VTLPSRPRTPAEAWAALQAGNERFVAGQMLHPSQDAAHRAELREDQHPFAVVFGCSDSRVAAEIVFDEGLGDLFVVRTAGHVIDTTVLGSVEYGVEVLGAPLVVVLGHDHCGAVTAAARALADGEVPHGLVRAVVDRVIPSIVGLAATGRSLSSLDVEELAHEHLRATAHMLTDYSDALSRRIAAGTCAVVAVGYTLADGTVRPAEVIGDISPAGAGR
jgi:carbonic anhydrase